MNITLTPVCTADMAAKKLDLSVTACRDFHELTREDFLSTCASHQSYGLPRTDADKRSMVSRFLNDREWVYWTDSRIAELCGVSHTLVSSIRREFETVANSLAAQAKGKNYPSDPTSSRRRSRLKTASTAEDSNVNEQLRCKVLHSLQQMKKSLKYLHVIDRHMEALDSLERDLRHA